MDKEKYSEEEALEEFFSNLKHSDYQGNTKLYNRIHSYKSRYMDGTLGAKAAKRVLTEFGGFEHQEFYTKSVENSDKDVKE